MTMTLEEAGKYLIVGDNQMIADEVGVTKSYVSAVRQGKVENAHLVKAYIIKMAEKRKADLEKFGEAVDKRIACYRGREKKKDYEKKLRRKARKKQMQ